MSVRMRHTSSHTKNRRSHHALVGTNIVKDKESGNLRLPHRVDEVTGMYRGKQIFTPKQKVVKAEKVIKGPEPKLPTYDEHAEHEHTEQKTVKGTVGRPVKSRPQARSGMGGGV